MTPERTEKFERVVHCRQPNLTVILENVHDSHNIGAVLRTCDSIGIKEIFVLYTEAHLTKDRLILGSRTSSGARKWVDVHLYNDIEACFSHVRKNYDHVFSTHLSEDAVSSYDLDLTQSVALLFGNERDGVSKEALAYSDGNFIIPQVGMVESLNISVACAVTLYEAFRQRKEKGFFDENPQLNEVERKALFEEYKARHVSKLTRKKVFPK